MRKRSLVAMALACLLLPSPSHAGDVAGVCVMKNCGSGCPKGEGNLCNGCSCDSSSSSPTGGAAGALVGVFTAGTRNNYDGKKSSRPSLFSKLFGRSRSRPRSRSTSAWRPPAARMSFMDAARALSREQWSSAESGFRSVLSSDPANAGAHKGLAWALIKQGRGRDAVSSLRSALQLDPKDALAKSLLAFARADEGKALFAAGNLDAALAAYQEAVALDPNDKAAAQALAAVQAHRATEAAYRAEQAKYDAAVVARSKPTPGSASTALEQLGGAATLDARTTKDEYISDKVEARKIFDEGGPRGGVVVAVPSPIGRPVIPPEIRKRPEVASLIGKRDEFRTKKEEAQKKEQALLAQPATPALQVEIAKVREQGNAAKAQEQFLDFSLDVTVTRLQAEATPAEKSSDAPKQ